MRSIANTSISFGLVNVPVKMYSGVESHDMAFHQYHVHEDGTAGRIQQIRRCAQCADEVAYADVTKGVERGDTVITVTADELSAVEADSGKAFDVLRFVDADAINPLTLQASYFLEPDVKLGKTALEGYVLLRTVLAESRRVGIVRYTQRSKTHLAVLRVVGDVLAIQNICWPAELRAPEFSVLAREVVLRPEVVKAATALVESMLGEFDTADADYVDTYTEAVNDLIDAKASGAPVTVREEQAAEAEVSDLLAALEASVARHPAGHKRAKKGAA